MLRNTLLHHPQIIPPILPNKEKYTRPIHSLQHSFSLTLPRLPPTIYFYLKIHPTRDFILSFSPLRDKQHRNRSVQRDRGEAETVWRGNFSRNICRTRRINSSRPRIDWPPACRAELTHFRSNRASEFEKTRAGFFRADWKKERKKEREKKQRSLPRGIGFFQGFPRKEFLTRSWLSLFSNISEPTVATNTTRLLFPGVESLPRISTDYKSSSPDYFGNSQRFRGFREFGRDFFFGNEKQLFLSFGWFVFFLSVLSSSSGRDISWYSFVNGSSHVGKLNMIDGFEK